MLGIGKGVNVIIKQISILLVDSEVMPVRVF